MNGCKMCPAYGECTVTYRGPFCAILRRTYGIDDDPEIVTNADRIRAMSDEELATLLLDGCRGSKCSEQPQNEYGSVDCFSCRLNWLKQPIKEGE